MTIHDFPLSEQYAVPALAELVDGVCFLFHRAPEPRIARLRTHPKCIAHARYHRRFSVGGTLRAAIELARPFAPKYIINFDEDELPPGRFAEEFEEFRNRSAMSLAFRDFICWGSPDMIVADGGYPSPLHCHVLRWNGAELGRYKKADFFEYYYRRPVWRSDYPLRNLAFMTPELRERRFERSQAAISTRHWKHESAGPRAWPRQAHAAMPYDPNLGYSDYVKQEGKWKQSA